jgi:hypothetical protein
LPDDRAQGSVLRTMAVGAVGLVLLWQIVTTTVVGYLAASHPEIALGVQPRNAAALMILAQRKLEAEFSGGVVAPTVSARLPREGAANDPFGGVSAFAKAAQIAFQPPSQKDREGAPDAAGAMPRKTEASGGDVPQNVGNGTLTPQAHAAVDQIRNWVQTALASEPLTARGYRILGQLSSIEGDDLAAEALMAKAAKLSLHESIALHWLMRRAIDNQDYGRAGYFMDALLRTRPQLRDAVMPSLVQIAESEAGSGVIKELLADNPPWRSGLFPVLSLFVTDARTPLSLFLHLKTTKVPPTTADIRPYLDFLMAKRLYELAYDTWLQFLPDAQLGAAGHLFNARFEFALSDLPFDWRIAAKSGVTGQVVGLPEGGDARALSIEFRSGQVEFGGVTQTVLLRPGSYQFTGRRMGTLVGRRGLKWRVVCADTPAAAVGESQMFVGVGKTWEAFSFAFTVPASGCGAQIVRLDLDARSASERLVTGTMLFTDLELVKVEGVAAGALKEGK